VRLNHVKKYLVNENKLTQLRTSDSFFEEICINTFLWPSPDICARTFPFGPITTNVGQEFTPSSLHKYMSPSFTTFQKGEHQIRQDTREHWKFEKK
jgi:hypothetical protein